MPAHTGHPMQLKRYLCSCHLMEDRELTAFSETNAATLYTKMLHERRLLPYFEPIEIRLKEYGGGSYRIVCGVTLVPQIVTRRHTVEETIELARLQAGQDRLELEATGVKLLEAKPCTP